MPIFQNNNTTADISRVIDQNDQFHIMWLRSHTDANSTHSGEEIEPVANNAFITLCQKHISCVAQEKL